MSVDATISTERPAPGPVEELILRAFNDDGSVADAGALYTLAVAAERFAEGKNAAFTHAMAAIR
jgi:hypothetical protein